MDLIVLLNWGQRFGEEGDWVPFFIGWGHLGEDGACSKVRTVSFDMERLHQVWGNEHWGSHDILLEFVKGSLLVHSPVPFAIIPGQVEEQVGMLGKVFNKPAVEVSEPKERLYLFLIGQGRPFCGTHNLDQVHGNGVVGYDHSEVLNRGFSNSHLFSQR